MVPGAPVFRRKDRVLLLAPVAIVVIAELVVMVYWQAPVLRLILGATAITKMVMIALALRDRREAYVMLENGIARVIGDRVRYVIPWHAIRTLTFSPLWPGLVRIECNPVRGLQRGIVHIQMDCRDVAARFIEAAHDAGHVE